MKKKLYAGFTAGADTAAEALKASLSGADGLFLTDVSADDASHDAFMGLVRSLAREVDAPILSGGRVKRTEDVKKYLYAGSEAAFLDAALETNLALIREVSERFGKGKIVLLAAGGELPGGAEEDVCRYVSAVVADPGTAEAGPLPVPEGYPGEVFVMVPPSYEVIAGRMKDPRVSGVIVRCDGGARPDFMELKQALRKDGVEVQTFETDVTWDKIKKGSDGLLPVVVQDYRTLDVLMVAYMNEEAFLKTLECGRMTYWSRSRQELWLKGDTSGHYQYVRSLTLDCDSDTLLAKVFQVGAACHTGSRSCFFNEVTSLPGVRKNPHRILEDDYQVIKDRKAHPKAGSYTNYLFDKGIDKILKKVGEEATEIVIAAKNPDPEEIKYEIADFLYHAMVLMVERGVTWEDIMQELANR